MAVVRNPAVDLAAIRAGSDRALLDGAIALLMCWFHSCGHSARHQGGAMEVALHGDSAKGGLLAAGIDLRQLLAQSPQGRQALRDFGFEPFLEHVEGE